MPRQSMIRAKPPRKAGVWTPEDLEDLERCKELLLQPSLAIRLSGLLGAPIEKGFAVLPAGITTLITNASQKALGTALKVATKTLRRTATNTPNNLGHQALVAATGGIGGAAGLAALPIELPLTTTIMLRSIAQIAKSEGHSLDSVETCVDCLLVFALGGPVKNDDSAETAFWTARASLSALLPEVVRSLGSKTMGGATAPVVVRWLASISSRFGLVLTEEVAAKAVPVLGAASGAAINVVFLKHFQRIARGHFILRRLELIHGTEEVQNKFNSGAG